MGRATYLQHINHNMSLLDYIIGKIAPHDCLGCGSEGSLLCKRCSADLPPVRAQYFDSALHRVQSATVYKGVAKDLVWKLKSDGAQEASKLMAEQMSRIIIAEKRMLVVHVPTATVRARQRGYDQARLLARALARQTGMTLANCLARHGQAHQVGAGRNQRLHQLSDAFRVTKSNLIRNAHILLVDDVVTTGATLETAAATLKKAGAAHVEAITFAFAPLNGRKEG